jgi:hypothetical protein
MFETCRTLEDTVLLKKLAEAGRVAMKRSQHVMWNGKLVQYDVWRTWQDTRASELQRPSSSSLPLETHDA